MVVEQLSEHVLHGENESGAEWLLNNSLSMSYKVRMSHCRVFVEKESLPNNTLSMSYKVRMSRCRVIVKREGYAKQLSEHVLHGENESGAEWLLNNSLSMSYKVRMSLARSGC